LFAERKAQKALDTANEYRETYHSEIAMYDNAEKYLKDVLQARFDPKKLPPVSKWKEERAAKIAERQTLNGEYHALKDEIREVETIRKYAEQIQRTIEPKQRTREQGIDL
jgi:hypothetical protein